MSSNSIYISIPCLGFDSELFNTIKSAIDNSDDSTRVHIGIAMMGDKKYYNDIVEKLKGYSNVQIGHFPPDVLGESISLGRAREKAKSFYNNQDFYLQIDSHTFFEKGWDSELIIRLNMSCESADNKKTVITGIPGSYGYFNKKNKKAEFWVDNRPRYPKILKDTWNETEKVIPKFDHFYTEDMPQISSFMHLRNNIVPCLKISGGFIFGNKKFAEYDGNREDNLFWEEELVQTINLIGAGFSLVFVNKDAKVFHLYGDDIWMNLGERDNIFTNANSPSDLVNKMAMSFSKYIYSPENSEKIKKYIDYAGFDVLKNQSEEWPIIGNFSK